MTLDLQKDRGTGDKQNNQPSKHATTNPPTNQTNKQTRKQINIDTKKPTKQKNRPMHLHQLLSEEAARLLEGCHWSWAGAPHLDLMPWLPNEQRSLWSLAAGVPPDTCARFIENDGSVIGGVGSGNNDALMGTYGGWKIHVALVDGLFRLLYGYVHPKCAGHRQSTV